MQAWAVRITSSFRKIARQAKPFFTERPAESKRLSELKSPPPQLKLNAAIKLYI